MKKISAVLLSVLLCLSLFACTGADNGEVKTQVATVSSQVNQQSQANGDSIKNNGGNTQSDTANSGKTKNTSTAKNTTANNGNSDSGGQKNGAGKAQKPKSTNAQGKPNNTTATSSAQNSKPNSKPANTTATTKPSQTKAEYITCYVTVEYTALLDNMDKLQAGHEKYVNQSGYVLSDQSVTVKKGSTAYQAVKSVCDKNSVKISTTGSGKSVYIVGFNNIDEKDCGRSSGWTYYVNNSFPPKSCGAYTLSDGDVIRFSYVV